jgi:hypothetical protein
MSRRSGRAPRRYATLRDALEAGWASYVRATGVHVNPSMQAEITAHLAAALAAALPAGPPPSSPPPERPRAWWQD